MGEALYFVRVRMGVIIRDTGVFRRMPWIMWLPLGAVAAAVASGVYMLAGSAGGFLTLTAVAGLALLICHNTRRDSRLITVAGYKRGWVCLLEYCTVLLPLFVLGCFRVGSIALWVFVFPLIAFLPTAVRSRGGKALPWLGRIFSSYEWTTGIRRNWYWALPFIALACGLCTIPFAPFIVLVFFLLVCSEFYAVHEPLAYLVAAEKGPTSYMYMRIKDSVRDFAVITALPVALSVVFNPSGWWMVPVFILLAVTAIAYYVFVKYSGYIPNTTDAPASTAAGIGLLGIIIPFLYPLTLLLGVRYYFGARERLNHYLDDFCK